METAAKPQRKLEPIKVESGDNRKDMWFSSANSELIEFESQKTSSSHTHELLTARIFMEGFRAPDHIHSGTTRKKNQRIRF